MKTIHAITPGIYIANQNTVNKYKDCRNGRSNVNKGDKVTVTSVVDNLVACDETTMRMDAVWFATAFDKLPI